MSKRDLIARLEAATEGSRELDAEIAFDCFASPVGKHTADGGPSGYLWREDNPSWAFGHRFPGKDRAWFDRVKGDDRETLVIERDGALVLMNELRVLKFTTSLDDARTLVPKGWRLHGIDWSIIERPRVTLKLAPDEMRKWVIECSHFDGPEDEFRPCFIMGGGKTLINALCVAALRAMEANEAMLLSAGGRQCLG